MDKKEERKTSPKKEGINKKKENISDKDDKENLTDKMRENPWVVSTFVLGILTLVLLVGNFSGIAGSVITGGVVAEGKIISLEDAGKIIIDFTNSQTEEEIELLETNIFEDGLYEVIVLYKGEEVPLYLTKDGENLVQRTIIPFSFIEAQSKLQNQITIEDNSSVSE